MEAEEPADEAPTEKEIEVPGLRTVWKKSKKVPGWDVRSFESFTAPKDTVPEAQTENNGAAESDPDENLAEPSEMGAFAPVSPGLQITPSSGKLTLERVRCSRSDVGSPGRAHGSEPGPSSSSGAISESAVDLKVDQTSI